MALTPFEHRQYKSVSALTTDNTDYTVPDGTTFIVTSLGGNSPTAASLTNMQIIWDPAGANQMLFGTYSAGFQCFLNLTFVGDGSKVMRIKLVNNDVSARIIGGFIAGVLDDGT